MDKQLQLGSSFPHGLPEKFMEVYAGWENSMNALESGTAVQEAVSALTFGQLITLASPHHFPTLRPELYRFALKELAARELDPDQRARVGQVWN
ncbi:MAG: hypothetical protein WC505_00610 [Patescibacteria group bacterium]